MLVGNKITINKTTREDIARYTFIEKVDFRNLMVFIYYNGGKYKKISYRATGKQLERIINIIKEEIGYSDVKKKRDILVRKELSKPMMFIGEDDE